MLYEVITKHVYRLPVEGIEVDRLVEEGHEDPLVGDLAHQGLPRVGYRDAVAHRGGHEPLALRVV